MTLQQIIEEERTKELDAKTRAETLAAVQADIQRRDEANARLLALLAERDAEILGLKFPPLFSCDWTKSIREHGFVEQSKNSLPRATIQIIEGRRCVRLITEPGDNNVSGSGSMERDDLMQAIDPMKGLTAPLLYGEGTEQWWSFGVLFDSNFQFPTWQDYNLTNFHDKGGVGVAPFRLAFLRDPTSDLKPGRLCLAGAGGGLPTNPVSRYPTSIAIPNPIPTNVWFDFVLHVKWTAGEGFMHGWVNGSRKLTYNGPTLFTGSSVYFKFGNYHLPICDPYPACVGTHKASAVCYSPLKMGRAQQSVTSAVLE